MPTLSVQTTLKRSHRTYWLKDWSLWVSMVWHRKRTFRDIQRLTGGTFQKSGQSNSIHLQTMCNVGFLETGLAYQARFVQHKHSTKQAKSRLADACGIDSFGIIFVNDTCSCSCSRARWISETLWHCGPKEYSGKVPVCFLQRWSIPWFKVTSCVIGHSFKCHLTSFASYPSCSQVEPKRQGLWGSDRDNAKKNTNKNTKENK